MSFIGALIVGLSRARRINKAQREIADSIARLASESLKMTEGSIFVGCAPMRPGDRFKPVGSLEIVSNFADPRHGIGYDTPIAVVVGPVFDPDGARRIRIFDIDFSETGYPVKLSSGSEASCGDVVSFEREMSKSLASHSVTALISCVANERASTRKKDVSSHPEREIKVNLSPEEWIDLVRGDSPLLSGCCASVAAIRRALLRVINNDFVMTTEIAETIVAEGAGHDPSETEALLKDAVGVTAWTRKKSPLREVFRCCALLLAGDGDMISRSRDAFKRRIKEEEAAQERARETFSRNVLERLSLLDEETRGIVEKAMACELSEWDLRFS